MIQGAIFDMDGVLLDNLDFHLQAFKLFGKEQGRTLADDQIQAVFGRKNSDMLRALLDKELTEEEIERCEARKEELYRELISPQLQETVVSGLLEFVQALRRANFGIALATSGPVDNVEMVLDGLGLQNDFDFLVTGEQVKRGKPHPEAFLRAAEGLNLPASECVVFEDSFSGVEAALRANCKCVALATTHTEQDLGTVSPHRIMRLRK
jgi:beta-phosphoglucomutase family hydrolase